MKKWSLFPTSWSGTALVWPTEHGRRGIVWVLSLDPNWSHSFCFCDFHNLETCASKSRWRCSGRRGSGPVNPLPSQQPANPRNGPPSWPPAGHRHMSETSQDQQKLDIHWSPAPNINPQNCELINGCWFKSLSFRVLCHTAKTKWWERVPQILRVLGSQGGIWARVYLPWKGSLPSGVGYSQVSQGTLPLAGLSGPPEEAGMFCACCFYNPVQSWVSFVSISPSCCFPLSRKHIRKEKWFISASQLNVRLGNWWSGFAAKVAAEIADFHGGQFRRRPFRLRSSLGRTAGGSLVLTYKREDWKSRRFYSTR